MKTLIFGIILAFVTITVLNAQTKSIYSYTVTDIDGNDFPMEQLKGKKIMIVNVASKCGLTPQYKKLEEVYSKYKDDGFVIVGFPANNFMKQEPGSDEEIKEFCTENYGVTFPMMSKISVKNESMAPIYQWLTSESLNGYKNSSVKWNFQKYLINEKGELVDVIGPSTKPDSNKIITWIESDS